jgi:hypothetical protein
MTEIKLGQSIAGSFTSTKDSVDNTNPLTATYFNEYNLPGLDGFRQFQITLQLPAGITTSTKLELIDAATGDVIAQSIQAGTVTLSETTFPGINYKIRVTNASLGDYQLSMVVKRPRSSVHRNRMCSTTILTL